jgi:hypothetical protein
MPLPATPSQRNLDMRPPGTTVPPAQTTVSPPPAVTQPQPQPKGTAEQTDVPPSGGKRPQPGGAGSSQLSLQDRTGKNPLNETLTSCLGMWEPATHMSRQEWSRACRRVANRLQNLQVK